MADLAFLLAGGVFGQPGAIEESGVLFQHHLRVADTVEPQSCHCLQLYLLVFMAREVDQLCEHSSVDRVSLQWRTHHHILVQIASHIIEWEITVRH